MNIAVSVIIFIVILFTVVVFHELGHFFVARHRGIVVEEFGLGIPPRLFGVKRGETTYSLNAIPLGAFVKTASETDPDNPQGLAGKGPWTRLAVYAAGPLVNIFLAFILLSIFFFQPVNIIVSEGIMVHSVVENSPAVEAGIRPGDIILVLSGQDIHTTQDIQDALEATQVETVPLLLEREGESIETSVSPEISPTTGTPSLGVFLCWNRVSQVVANSPADIAGILPGDTIISIDEQGLYTPEDMSAALNSLTEKSELHLSLFREGEQTPLSVTIIAGGAATPSSLGISMQWVEETHLEQQRLPAWKALQLGGGFILDLPDMIVASIPELKSNPRDALVGPIGAGQLTVEMLNSSGFGSAILMASIISLGIGLFNFLPIPPLDGGGMLIAIIEGARRGRRLPDRSVRMAQTISTALLITMVVMITFSDIARLVSGAGFGL